MGRRGILIKGGIVENVIVWGDESEAQYEADGWDVAMETTDLEIQPGIGWTWNEVDGFRPPKPYTSWKWVKASSSWEAPTPYPIDGDTYEWDEETLQWSISSTE